MRDEIPLLQAAQRLSYARSMDEVVGVLSHVARQLSGADGVSVVLRDGELCHYVEEDAISPLWKGRRFPMEACVSGLCMRDRRSICIPDIYEDDRVPHDAYRPTFVKSLALVPIRSDSPIGAVGAYWAIQHLPSKREVAMLQTLADSAALAMENVQLINRLSDESEQKDRLLMMLAHELRSPLGPIGNAAQVIAKLVPENEAVQRSTEIITRQTAHMARLVTGLLDASRIANGRVELDKQLLNLGALVEKVIEDRRFLAEKAGLDLKTAIPSTPVWVRADFSRIEQVVANVLENALKYTQDGAVFVRVSVAAPNATIVITDTGIGIAPEFLDAVFKPFSQADVSLARASGGVGLGLCVAKNLVEHHGGSIHVASPGLGSGTTVTISLPSSEEVPAPPIQNVPDGSSVEPGFSPRVLIIEDNIDAAQSLKAFLEIAHHTVLVAHDGVQGVELALSWAPDVILCDIGLPGYDGFEVIRRLRQNPSTATCPVAAVTGYGKEFRERILDAGFSSHLVKPVDPVAVEVWIKRQRVDRMPLSDE